MPVTEQRSWFLRTPLMQQSSLLSPSAAPTLPHPAPPHLVQPSGQHTEPLLFVPSKPGTPSLQTCLSAGRVFEVGVNISPAIMDSDFHGWVHE